MFYRLLQHLPGGENFKVFVGVSFICAASTALLMSRERRATDKLAMRCARVVGIAPGPRVRFTPADTATPPSARAGGKVAHYDNMRDKLAARKRMEEQAAER